MASLPQSAPVSDTIFPLELTIDTDIYDVKSRGILIFDSILREKKINET